MKLVFPSVTSAIPLSSVISCLDLGLGFKIDDSPSLSSHYKKQVFFGGHNNFRQHQMRSPHCFQRFLP
jgi:hypothetical protein